MSTSPARTELGRVELLERKLLSDSRLRSLLAQCDGKIELAKLKLRFAALMDVEGALRELIKLGLVELLIASEVSSSPEPATTPQMTSREPAPVAVVPAKKPQPDMAAPGSDDELGWFPKSWNG